MTQPSLHFVTCANAPAESKASTTLPDAAAAGDVPVATHNMAYWQWGNPDSDHVVLCVHGLTRQGRDFDVLAQALCEQAGGNLRVVCPDVVGRGRSDWLEDPAGYQVPNYAADMLALIAALHQQRPIATLDWVGTSMGGLIGIGVAGQPGLPLPVPLRRLILNDVGPVIEWQALVRIGTYLGHTGRFESLQQAADAMWAISSSFGPHTPAQWLALSRHMVKLLPGDAAGALTLHYDPSIALPFRGLGEAAAQAGEAMLWQLYDQITARVLITRGEQSDLLSPATALAMTQRGPRATLVEFEGVGHAPTLIAPDQISAVAHWLLE